MPSCDWSGVETAETEVSSQLMLTPTLLTSVIAHKSIIQGCQDHVKIPAQMSPNTSPKVVTKLKLSSRNCNPRHANFPAVYMI